MVGSKIDRGRSCCGVDGGRRLEAEGEVALLWG